ncbi:MAG: 3-phosphoglycerate dehydrogenase [Bacteroidales bacterium]|jgi:D-3-phosphoglycerate dehydrogenase|nr:3-phosphoglycerate dehydrogenase [Bacteroidales bacterium]MDD2263913.1 3-phosphoglycerate dehydrogenase [Bacteroidales bacterium]MDD2831147.1 3-phosphoglycerate dehydrogenase [Bacteroidales bacterium]MDD3209258.1 3-phosphoglycerate dehydrogenase [Bacteroidales bacterium]MDD3697615.1 3-phosphoglycerate dehydrogenase [Bacteroidales bacterium]
MKVLIATEKPFAKKAVDGIRSIVEQAGMTLSLLENYTLQEQLLEAVADADALIVRSDKVTRQVVQAAKRLKIVVRAGAGYDNLDLEACSEKNIVAMNTPGQNSNAVAELAIGMMIYMARKQFQPGTGTELKGKTLGVQAYGNVGRLVAGLAKGFGMKIYAYDPFIPASVIQAEQVHVAKTVEDLYSRSDYLSLHIPANDQTKGSIGKALLSLMPKGACLINTARKEVINETELEEILAERKDLKYATDVAPGNMEALKAQFDTRVFATPKKMGAQTEEANINAGLAAARQIVAFIQNGNKTFQLNK